jgi:hypothetical protein
MARKLHRRSADRFFFAKGANGGDYTTAHSKGMGIVHDVEEARRDAHNGPFFGYDIERVLRMVEAGFSDDAIAEALMIPVEEIEEMIASDKKRQDFLTEAMGKLFR